MLRNRYFIITINNKLRNRYFLFRKTVKGKEIESKI